MNYPKMDYLPKMIRVRVWIAHLGRPSGWGSVHGLLQMDYPNLNPNHFLGVVHFRVVHLGSPWTGGQCFVHHRIVTFFDGPYDPQLE